MPQEGDSGQGGGGDQSSHAPSERAGGPPVTDLGGFASAWPVVSSQVEQVLRRRGLGDDARDVVQETGLRALERLARGQGFDSAVGMYRWCRIVAVNLVTDQWRAGTPVDPKAPIVDVEAMVQWRVMLADVMRLLPQLPDKEREAVLSLLTGVSDPAHRGRQGMRLYRARQRLRRWTGGLPAGWRWRLRWVAELVPLGALSVGFVATAALVAQGSEPMPTHVVTTVGRHVADQSPAVGPSPVTTVPGRRARVHPPTTSTEPRPARVTLVEVPKPLGGTTRAGVSDNSPDKALACVDSDLVDLCVDKPGPVLDAP